MILKTKFKVQYGTIVKRNKRLTKFVRIGCVLLSHFEFEL